MAAEVLDKSSEDTVYIVKLGDSYKYTIPGFSVITVDLRHAKIQKSCNDGEVDLLDVFFKEEITSGMHIPTGVVVVESCFVEVISV